MTWRDIATGWGLEKVPRRFLGDLTCKMCDERRHLYTTMPLTPSKNTTAGWARMLERIRASVWCRVHATYLFGD